MGSFISSAITDENQIAINDTSLDIASCKAKGRICRLLILPGKTQL